MPLPITPKVGRCLLTSIIWIVLIYDSSALSPSNLTFMFARLHLIYNLILTLPTHTHTHLPSQTYLVPCRLYSCVRAHLLRAGRER